jgi:hypothetical protein
MFARVQIGQDRSAEINDDPAVRLVILHPMDPHPRGNDVSPASVFASSALASRAVRSG